MRRRIRLFAAALFAAPFFALLFAPAASAATTEDNGRIAASGVIVSVNSGLGIHADASLGGLYVHASLG